MGNNGGSKLTCELQQTDESGKSLYITWLHFVASYFYAGFYGWCMSCSVIAVHRKQREAGQLMRMRSTKTGKTKTKKENNRINWIKEKQTNGNNTQTNRTRGDNVRRATDSTDINHSRQGTRLVPGHPVSGLKMETINPQPSVSLRFTTSAVGQPPDDDA